MKNATLILMLTLALGASDCKEIQRELPNGFFPKSTMVPEGDCFQSLTVKGNGGTLTSPNYPNAYPSSTDCKWLLTTQEPNATILLRIDSLAIEADTNCKLDYLQVYLGPTTLSPSLGPFCGQVKDLLLRTNSSRILVVFHSDPVREDKGFSVDYFAHTTNAGCQDLLTEESGTLRSPGFPAPYPDNTDCWTIIRVGSGKRIVLTFESVDMEYGDNCTFDYVRVLDGETRDSPLLGRICRQTDTVSLESSSHSLLVHFHADGSVGGKGYRASYFAVDRRSAPIGECLWESGESNGTVASPNHPSNYPSHSNCSLWVLAPRGNRVLLVFDALQLEMDAGCPYDFLQIEETDPKGGTRVLGRYCGNVGEPKNLTSTQNEVHIVFYSDDFVEFSGFKLRYFFLDNDQKKRTESLQKLSFSVVPQNASLEGGSSHMMHCAARQADAKIRWSKGDTLLTGGSPLPGLKVLSNGTLWIQNMEPTLSGIYTCTAQSKNLLSQISAKAYVLLKNVPKEEDCGIVFRKTPTDSSFAEGEFAHLECLAAGQQIQMSWEKDGKPLKPGGHVTMLRNGYLFVDRMKLEDGGVYTCVARDVIARCERRASALVQVTRRIRVEEVCGRSKVADSIDDVPQAEHGKIIGGHDAKKGAYPWQVMLWEPNLKSFCGATLLNERWIATAAHCFVNYRNLRWDRVVVKLGKYDREEEEPGAEFRTAIADSSSIVVHPAYNRHTFDNDLALVRLKDHVTFTDRILPACLGDKNFLEEGSNSNSARGHRLRTGMVVGWGKLKDNGPSPRFLQEIRLPVVDQDTCVKSTNYTVTRNMFCAGYSQEILGDACHGDSGGPFLMKSEESGRWHLVGVVSWGEGCGNRNKYGFYTRVPNYTSWIRGIIKS